MDGLLILSFTFPFFEFIFNDNHCYHSVYYFLFHNSFCMAMLPAFVTSSSPHAVRCSQNLYKLSLITQL